VKLKDLDPDQTAELNALLDEVLALPVSSRTSWLERLSGQGHTLHGLITDLLGSLAKADAAGLLETQDLVARHLAESLVREGPSHPGQVLGPYRILRLLAEGGMGSVWLAERLDGMYSRQVALKLMRDDIAGRAFAERFSRERSILGALDHPRIAKLLDAGTTAEGHAYLAIEYVDGMPLTSYCEAQRLPIRARVELVMQVLEAVQYAHERLVVHRDLKPNNILVSADGEAHLLDFGIAKLLGDSGEATETELTQLGGRAFTPDYASPEQIKGEPVTTASDVYSAGVLLYELLCGQRPYRLARASRAALEEAILEEEPVHPSQRVVDGPAVHARSTTAKRLVKALSGDLDTIVMKALKKRPGERYATAEAFRSDLQRFLLGLPVRARPDGRLYRARKFVARHRSGVVVAAALVATLGAGITGTAWQAGQARQEARRARAVQDFLTSLFDEAQPAKARGRELTARELLERGQRQLQSGLADQPRLNAELDGVLADLFIKLNAEDKAMPLAQARLATAQRLDGEGSLAYGDALAALARVHSGLVHHDLALETYSKARRVLLNHAAERQGELLDIERHRAFELVELQRHKEAVQLLDAAIPAMIKRSGELAWEVISAKALLSGACSWSGERERAARLAHEIAPLLDAVDPVHLLDAIDARNNIAYSFLAAWQPGEAATSLRGAIKDWQRVVGTDTPTELIFRRTLMLALGEIGNYEEAAQIATGDVQRSIRILGPDAQPTRLAESFAVRPLIAIGRTVEALEMARSSLAALPERSIQNFFAPAQRQDFENRHALALIYAGQAEAARVALGHLVDQARRDGHAKGDVYGRSLHYLAGAQIARGDWAAAIDASREAIQVFERSRIGADMYVARAQLTEAIALARQGHAKDALALLNTADAHLLKVSEASHPVRRHAQLVRAEVLRSLGQADEALRLEHEAREALKVKGAVLPEVMMLVP
jgi:eukaryotic-like serine/threonine-protein kinase